jgi:diaminohydroxyphosphoribosylaminopyrimidine deaminase/5-amino-6-(5-phosphoribosylamino)uracil reductase
MANAGEIAAMRWAVQLSARGLGTTSPNPPVGCVVLDHAGGVVGMGFHERKGEAHAEGKALAVAGHRARGGTAVVTLEPCNHVGRAPACRQLLLDAGITRVVIAAMDPTSRGEGGAEVLCRAGVSVETGVLEAEARLVLGPWLAALRRRRPQVTWAYQWAGGRKSEVPHGERERMRAQFDLVVGPDGFIEEGVVGGHGVDFVVPARAPQFTPAGLEELWASGVRTILLIDGDTDRVQGREAIDAVQVMSPAAVHDEVMLGGPPVPDGFAITSVARSGPFVVLSAERTAG